MIARGERRVAAAARTMVETLERRAMLSIAGQPFAQTTAGFRVGPMLADPKRSVVYVLDQTNNKVLAVDTSIGKTIASASVDGTPTSVAISLSGTELYVAAKASNVIDVYAIDNLTFNRSLAVTAPVGMAGGKNGRLYVAVDSYGTLQQIETQTGKVEFAVEAYGPLVSTNAAGTRLYVSDLGGSVESFDVSDTGVAPVDGAFYNVDLSNGRTVTLDDAYGRIYGMSGGVYGVQSVNLKTNAQSFWAFTDGAAYGTDAAVASGVPYVYASSQDPYDGGIFEYDRATGAATYHFSPSGGYKSVWQVEATPNGHVLYAPDTGYDQSNDELGLIGASSLVVANVPTARFKTGAAADGTVTFDASASAPYLATQKLTNYIWDFGDGTTGTGRTATHAYAKSGSYLANLTVTSSTGLADTAATSLYATAVVTPPPNTGTFASLATNGTLTVNGTANADAIALAYDYVSTINVTMNGQTQAFPYASVNNVIVNGNAGADALTIGVAFFRPVSYDGGAAGDTLTFNASEGNDTIALNTGSLTGGGNSATYANVEGLIVNGRFGYDTIRVVAATPGTAVSLNGGDGNDTIYARDGAVESIDGGPDLDRVIVDASDAVTNCEDVAQSGVGLSFPSSTLLEGTPYPLDLAFMGSTAVDWWTVDWGDGTVNQYAGVPATEALTVYHLFRDNGAPIVKATARHHGTVDDVGYAYPTVANVAPTATFAAASVGAAGAASTFAFTQPIDPSSADVEARLKYSFDFNNDGDFLDAGDVAGSTTPTAAFTFATAGTYAVRGRVADKDGGFTDYTTTVTVNATATGALTGTAIGTAGSFGNSGNTFAKALDGNLTTYFDSPSASGAWVGLDLGSAKAIGGVKFAPRVGWAQRMVGGTFQASNSADFSNATTLATVATKPVEGALTTLAVSNATSFRYVRYLSPNGGYANVAEVQFFGGTTTPPPTTPPTPPATGSTLAGTAIGTGGSFGNGGNTIAKAFDGSLATYVDLAAANGAWAGLDLGSAKTIGSIRYAPRAGWSSRMVGGVFQSSTTADFSSGPVTLATITAKPVEGALTTIALATPATARYVRYLSPNGSYGNVAEVQFVSGSTTTTTPPPPTPGAKLAGTTIGTSGSFGNGGNTIAKALDGDLATYADLPAANGNWVGLDLGAAMTIGSVQFAPRVGWAQRMVGGLFQGSSSANFSNAITLATIATKPAEGVLTTLAVTNASAFRYVRFLSPNGGYGNVAEVRFFA